MTEMTTEQRARLPQYARETIHRLERQLAEARAHLEGLRGQNATEVTYVAEALGEERPLPAGSHVTFRPDPAKPHESFDVFLQDGSLMVYTERTLAVYPRASNCVRLARGTD